MSVSEIKLSKGNKILNLSQRVIRINTHQKHLPIKPKNENVTIKPTSKPLKLQNLPIYILLRL